MNRIEESMELQNDHCAGPIFAQPWWLDAVAPGRWGEVLIEKGGKLHARLPYVLEKWRGFTLISMPPLTQNLGPWIDIQSEKVEKRLSREKELMLELIERIPPHNYFLQNFHFSVSNWLPFYWRGFQQTTRYTYRLDTSQDLEKLWAGLRENIRWDIRKAGKTLKIKDQICLSEFMDLNRSIYRDQGLKVPFKDELFVRLDDACKTHDCRRMIGVEDELGHLHASVYLVWDDDSVYYLTGGTHPGFRGSGANSLALWEAIKFSMEIKKTMDFEGSMIERIEHFFRGFGARQFPYFQVSKYNSRLLKMYHDFRSWLR